MCGITKRGTRKDGGINYSSALLLLFKLDWWYYQTHTFNLYVLKQIQVPARGRRYIFWPSKHQFIHFWIKTVSLDVSTSDTEDNSLNLQKCLQQKKQIKIYTTYEFYFQL